jgi:hypothetical protein
MRDMFMDGVRNGFLDEDGSPIISGPFGLFSYGKPFSGPHPRSCPAGEA